MGKLKLYSLLVFAVATPVEGQILPPAASVERLATGYSFTEGPVYDGNGNLFFSNIFFSATPSQIIRYDDSTGMTEVVDGNSGQSNGLFFDHNGQVISTDMGRRQVSRRTVDDISIVEEVLASEWNGIGFNSPNDLVIASDGGIYFSDPDYLGRGSQPDAVYYLNPSGELAQIMSGFRRPNGIILSPNGQTLYLAVADENRIMAYDIGADGLPDNEREFAKTNGGPDGMTVDPAGNVYAAVERAVSVWGPTGQPLFDISVPERASNVTFGGADGRTLFITASSSLYGIELDLADPFPSMYDFNSNGVADVEDIDLLTSEIVAGTNPDSFDLNGDEAVDIIDLSSWLTIAGEHNGFDGAYLRGDANLDGSVNSLDLNSLALNWRKNDVPRWSGGDFTADGSINALDLNQLGLNWRHSIVASANTAPVPEPSSLLLALVGCVFVSRRHRRD